MFKKGNLPILIKESNLCGVSSAGDSCGGDSGGGVLRQDLKGGYDELVGIVSFGVGCNSSINGMYCFSDQKLGRFALQV